MSDLTPERLDQIEQAAKDATPGPWHADEYADVCTADGKPLAEPNCGGYSEMTAEDAKHIANTDPATTLALIKRVRELEACIAAVRELHKPFQCSECEQIDAFDGCVECDSESNWPCDTIKALGGTP